jgi:hypothetical protein
MSVLNIFNISQGNAKCLFENNSLKDLKNEKNREELKN